MKANGNGMQIRFKRTRHLLRETNVLIETFKAKKPQKEQNLQKLPV